MSRFLYNSVPNEVQGNDTDEGGETLILPNGMSNRLCSFIYQCDKYDNEIINLFMYIYISILSLFVFLGMVGDYYSRGKWQYDTTAINYVYHIRNENLNVVFKTITSTGNFISILTATIIILAIMVYAKKRYEALFFAFNILGLWLFNEILKQIFRRPRPTDIWLVNASDFSFPSGHAMIFMGFSLLIIYYILNSARNKGFAAVISIIILIYSILVGLSRVYVGVHYLSDVLGGWFAGTFWVSTSIAIYKLLKYRKNS